MSTQDSFLVSIAFGFPKDGEIELHGVITPGMTALEAPRVDPKTLKPDWDEWVREHIQVRDATDQPVEVRYRSGTDIIPPNKIKGFAEGYFVARLKQNAPHTLDYISKRAETGRFRHEFAAPSGDTGVETPAFKLQ